MWSSSTFNFSLALDFWRGIGMFRRFALAVVAVVLPTVACSQEHRLQGPGTRQFGQPHGLPQVAPRGGSVIGAQGRFIYRAPAGGRVAIGPFPYPRGWGYRRWLVGAILPPILVVPGYFFDDWATLGLAAPAPGFQWVRYGPDLLLVDLSTSQVVDAIYGAFY
jgi:Nickel/cobalt transporter regulator